MTTAGGRQVGREGVRFRPSQRPSIHAAAPPAMPATHSACRVGSGIHA